MLQSERNLHSTCVSHNEWIIGGQFGKTIEERALDWEWLGMTFTWWKEDTKPCSFEQHNQPMINLKGRNVYGGCWHSVMVQQWGVHSNRAVWLTWMCWRAVSYCLLSFCWASKPCCYISYPPNTPRHTIMQAQSSGSCACSLLSASLPSLSICHTVFTTSVHLHLSRGLSVLFTTFRWISPTDHWVNTVWFYTRS